MDKPFLHKKLSLSDAATELKLDVFTHPTAVEKLLQYAQFDGLKIHIDSDIMGYKADKPLIEDFDPSGFPGMVSVDGEITPVSYLNGSIRFLSGSYVDDQKESFYINVSKFSQNNVDYYSVEDSGHLLYPSSQKEDCFYIVREDLQEFIDSYEKSNNSSTLRNEKSLPNNEDGGVIKALAILARERAENSAKFRTGDKVNASAFKDFIVEKAEIYGITPHGLKSLDDKINKTLSLLDLKDLAGSNDS